MFGLSFFEILFLLAMALIVIGPKQLPQVARTLGRFLQELRRSANIITEQMKQSVVEEEKIKPPPPQPPVEVEAATPPDEKKGGSHHG